MYACVRAWLLAWICEFSVDQSSMLTVGSDRDACTDIYIGRGTVSSYLLTYADGRIRRVHKPLLFLPAVTGILATVHKLPRKWRRWPFVHFVGSDWATKLASRKVHI